MLLLRTVLSRCSAILYQEQKRYDEAISSYKMAIQCRPRLTSKQVLVQCLIYLHTQLLRLVRVAIVSSLDDCTCVVHVMNVSFSLVAVAS